MTSQETVKFNKSSFIRERPNMKVQEIVDEAEKMGQTISPGTIWTLRSSDKRKAMTKKVKAAREGTPTTPKAKKSTKKVVEGTKKVAKKAVKTSEGKKFNKSAFIRRYPKLSAGDIVFKASELGQEITTGMIYTLRSADKRKEEPEGRVAKKTTKKAAKKTITRSRKTGKTMKTLKGRPSISFDPSDPVARALIAAGLAATA